MPADLGRSGHTGYGPVMTDKIYRLMNQQSWLRAQSTGVFEGSEDDRWDGFIHFSTAATVRETARRYYADVADLMLLEVCVDDLGESLKWEPSRGGILFPHLYAALKIALVGDAVLLERTKTGHVFGPEIP